MEVNGHNGAARDFITTYTGKKFYPLSPIAEDIDIRDIAHAQSYMTRANGHMKSFYSVAQHSINCAAEAAARGYSTRVQLAALLHDASEAYLSDITRPVKKALPGYLQIESGLMDAIYEHFRLGALTEIEQSQVSEVDDAMLFHEFIALKDVYMSSQIPGMLSAPDFSQQPFGLIEEKMIDFFNNLSEKLTH